MTDLTEIRLAVLMGNTKEAQILDLVLPLKDGTIFTEKQVITALGCNDMQIKPFVKALKHMAADGILLRPDKRPSVYTVNTKSNRVWAVKNLLVAMYADLAQRDSMKRLGIKE